MTTSVRIAILSALLAVAVGLLLSVGQSTGEEHADNAAMDSAYRVGDFKKAFELAQVNAKRGNVRAQTLLGTLYLNGEGVAADPEKASIWYVQAAVQGDAYAQNMRGEMFLRGVPAPRNYADATNWFREAAQQGLPQAKRNLCSMYYREQDTSVDYANAVRRLHMQAEMANSLAPYEMGKIYLDDKIVRDYGEAVRWFRFSAEQGMPQAQIELGKLYAHGLGVPQDYVMAHKWFNVAAALLSNVYVHGQQADAASRRDAIALKMTPTQVANAQAMARDWKPTPWETLMGRQIAPTE